VRETALLGLALAISAVAPAVATGPVASEVITTALDQPTFLTHAPGDTARVFVLERRGRVRIIAQDVVRPDAFLDIETLVSMSGEGGLLGLAFHPEYADNGRFYVSYTAPGGGAGVSQVSTVAEYRVSAGDPDVADPATARTVITIDQPSSNHDGGWIGFGPNDGHLYIAIGDGGVSGSGAERSQDLTDQLLGKLLRVCVDGDDFPGDDGRNYSIPLDNPYVALAGDDEIWASGLRNPWRCSFDRATGDLWIGDVGEGDREEIDHQPAASIGGENYGWGCMEGTSCTGDASCTCGAPDLTPPVLEYDHLTGCAIGGVAVYRGSALPHLAGTVFYGDFCQGRIFSFRLDDGSIVEWQERTAELVPSEPLTIWNIVAIGEDAAGELYLCGFAGEIVKIVPPPAADLDGDGDVDFGDLLVLLAMWGACGAECAADLDDDGDVDFADLLLLLAAWS
jgi:glucose/arabinose dehydrogenase